MPKQVEVRMHESHLSPVEHRSRNICVQFCQSLHRNLLLTLTVLGKLHLYVLCVSAFIRVVPQTLSVAISCSSWTVSGMPIGIVALLLVCRVLVTKHRANPRRWDTSCIWFWMECRLRPKASQINVNSVELKALHIFSLSFEKRQKLSKISVPSSFISQFMLHYF